MFDPRHRKSLAVALALLAAFAQVATLGAAPLRVATFNINEGLARTGLTELTNTAIVLQRIGADVVGFQELQSDSANLQAMGALLGLPHSAYNESPFMQVGLLSRYPVTTYWVDGTGMTRPILLARIDVPGALRDPWVAVVHLKCCGSTGGTEQYTRAVELYRLRQALALRTSPQDPVILMGDFNLVADNDWTYQSGTVPDVPYPLFAPSDADGYFVPEGIFKMDARQAGTGGETWTWRSNGIFPSNDLDHIMINPVVRARGTAVEIYNAEKDAAGIAGLPKQGAPLASGFAYISDHLPVFADIDLEDGNPTPANLVVSAAGALTAEGPRGGPFTPASGTYVLSNTGSAPLAWQAEHDTPWLSLSATEGTLASGSSMTITASLLPGAASLPVGGHRAALRFVNTSNGLGTTTVAASVFVAPFVMDGQPDAAGYTLAAGGITLRAAVRGTRLYVATQSAGSTTGGNDHHILIANSLLESAGTAAPWAKRGFTALPAGSPFLAAEGVNTYAGWFNAKNATRLRKSTTSAGVLEGSIDLVEEFGAMPEFIYLAAVSYETRDASPTDALAGRVVGQAPAAAAADDNITPDEFLRVPVRSVTDSAADGRFDVLVPGRGFAAAMTPPSEGSTVLWWRSVPGRSYRVWHSSNLAAGIWENVTTVSAGANEWEKAQPIAVQGSAFYRVELLAPGL